MEHNIFMENQKPISFEQYLQYDENSRSNLGETLPVLVYRMLEYSIKEELIAQFGKEKQIDIFREAGQRSGEYFARHMLNLDQPLNAFISELQAKMQDLKIGVLRIENIDEQSGRIILTVSEDADCSGLPVLGETVCNYEEGFISGILSVMSLRDPEDKEKYHDDDEMWNKAENALREVMDSLGIEYTEEIGEAAFYGPKLDVNVKPAVGNEYTLSTCQLDFCLPAKFELTYVDRDGEKKTPVVLHRAILGSLDRFMAYILEETKGNLPTWLAPVQARIMPVKTDDPELNEYAQKIYDALDAADVRVELDNRAEKLGYRMREGQVQKVPYLLVIGMKEKEDGTVAYRLHGQKETTVLPLDEFVTKLTTEIETKAR